MKLSAGTQGGGLKKMLGPNPGLTRIIHKKARSFVFRDVHVLQSESEIDVDVNVKYLTVFSSTIQEPQQ